MIGTPTADVSLNRNGPSADHWSWSRQSAAVSSTEPQIERAVREALTSYRATIRRHRRQLVSRDRVHAIDALLDTLELRHLQGNREYDRDLRRTVQHLGELLAMPPPRKVLRARNTVRLHAALLEWQGEVLDQVAPWRADCPGAHDIAGERDLFAVPEEEALTARDAA